MDTFAKLREERKGVHQFGGASPALRYPLASRLFWGRVLGLRGRIGGEKLSLTIVFGCRIRAV